VIKKTGRDLRAIFQIIKTRYNDINRQSSIEKWEKKDL
jgi:hypothetical protein